MKEASCKFFFTFDITFFLLVTYVGERAWWHIESPKKEEREKLRGEEDEIKFVDLRLERGKVVGFGKGRRITNLIANLIDILANSFYSRSFTFELALNAGLDFI